MNIIEKKIENSIIIDTDDNDTNDEDNETIGKNDIINISANEVNLKDNNFDKLKLSRKSPSCGLIIIDNFYNNAMETRNYILSQEFSVKGNFPGQRTISYANEHLKEIIQKYIEPFGGKITEFPYPSPDNLNTKPIYNGSFQYTTSRDRSWVHTDKWNNWAGIIFMTPDAPISGGTAFYKYKDGATCEEDGIILNNTAEVTKYTQDMTKWEMVDRVGNVFNRLILFNAHRYHMSMDYFGDTKENGRLFQTFFFSTDKN
jgi:hypothetical protein